MKFKVGQRVMVVTWRHTLYNDQIGMIIEHRRAWNYERTAKVNKYVVITLAGNLHMQENELREVKQ